MFNSLLPEALRLSAPNAKASGSCTARRIGPVPLRDHRKCLAIDGETAFVGSCNIARDATGEAFGGTSRFFDIHFRVWGPAALDLAALIVQTLKTAGAEEVGKVASAVFRQCASRIDVSEKTSSKLAKRNATLRRPVSDKRSILALFFQEVPPWPCVCNEDKGGLLQVLASDVTRNKRSIQAVVQQAIDSVRNAKGRLFSKRRIAHICMCDCLCLCRRPRKASI